MCSAQPGPVFEAEAVQEDARVARRGGCATRSCLPRPCPPWRRCPSSCRSPRTATASAGHLLGDPHDVVAVLAVEKCAPYEQQPCTSSGAGPVSTPWQPQPKMQSHDESRKVTSICQRRPSSFGSSNVTHSRVGPFVYVLPCPSTRPWMPSRYARTRDVTLLGRALGPTIERSDSASVGFGHRRRPRAPRRSPSRARPDRARAEPLELLLYGRDAGVERGEAAVVCFPATGADVAAAVRVAARHDRPFVARGSGTGLAGGATPARRPVVIVTTQMNRDPRRRPDRPDRVGRAGRAEPRPEPRRRATSGLHYAPDPSSQAACSIGGNVATNAGGPHCLAYGVTAAHVRRGRRRPRRRLGRASSATAAPDQPGYDLRGCFVGSEGTMGIARRIAVRLTPNPPVVRTLLLDFTAIDDAAATVSGIIARRDRARRARDDGRRDHPRGRGLRRRRATRATPTPCCSSSSTGSRAASRRRSRPSATSGCATARAPSGSPPTRRSARCSWKGRKSAFGAIARIAPDYYLHDAVVPRTKLVDVLRQVYAIADEQRLTMMNVFHAGDGNLHPLIVFDAA